MFKLSVARRAGAVVVAIVLGTTIAWGLTPEQEAKLTASDAATEDRFGFSVALSGDTAVVGAIGDDHEAGSAYVFVRSGTSWTEQVKSHVQIVGSSETRVGAS